MLYLFRASALTGLVPLQPLRKARLQENEKGFCIRFVAPINSSTAVLYTTDGTP